MKALEQDIEIPTELALLVAKRPLLMDMDENFMFSNESSSASLQPPLKIEAKLNGKTIMLKIQCENHKGVVVKAMFEIEKFPIIITNTSIMPFGDDSSLDMVIMAQVSCLINFSTYNNIYACLLWPLNQYMLISLLA